MQRRTFLKAGAAGAVAVGGAALLGGWQAHAAPVGALDTAPTTPFRVGVRRYNWTRGSRPCTTYVYYPATGAPGGNPVTDAPVAAGVFPVYNFTHGYGSSPQNSLFIIRALAAAGFIVPAPHFQHNFSDVNNGNTSKDVSEILTRTLALNGSGPLAGHINTSIGVGVSGHSLGGMTTHGLLTSWPDSRIISANPQSCVDMGNPASSVKAKVLFVHGDRDSTTQYSSARQAYTEMPAPKAFLTFVGGSHTSFWSDSRFPATVVDWARWSMYGDTAARDRLPSDAAGPNTRWEANLGTPPGQRYEAENPPAVCQGTIDSNHTGFSGSGFCNGSAAAGAYSELTVNAVAAGTATLGVRFANGTSSARPASLVVNGSTVATVSFESTGTWSTWSTKTLTASLNAGSNTVRLVSTTAAGLPNVDFIDVR
ncbi:MULTISPECIES: carbohydrate-binding protein [unclassified Micromonospora]|uniref:carbohydrate-binding protein n=1 Tax=unclassified Micromonospora TaxID=2617518 RepID=UPI001A9CD34D|nr:MULTISPECIES: CBM35 domain-containing protein [unclassified Micromonospora]